MSGACYPPAGKRLRAAVKHPLARPGALGASHTGTLGVEVEGGRGDARSGVWEWGS